VWELIDGRNSMDEIVEVITREFDVTRERALAAVGAFVQQLLDKSLITAVS